MRLHAVFLLVIVLAVASSNGFFIKKAAATLSGVKLNLVKDVKTAIGDLKESAKLKAKAVTGGIKAIGNAKLGFLNGVKHAKIGVLTGIAGAKLAKLAALKAGKVAFAKTLVAAKLAPVVAGGIHSGGLKTIISALPAAPEFFQSLTNKLGATSSKLSIDNLISSFGESSSSIRSDSSQSSNNLVLFPSTGIFQALKDRASSAASKLSIGHLVSKLGSFGRDGSGATGNSNFVLFPTPIGIPSHINVVTYKNEAQKDSQSQFSGNHGYPSRPLVNNVPATPAISYGTPILPPSTSYEIPILPPSTSYGTPILPPSDSYGSPIRR